MRYEGAWTWSRLNDAEQCKLLLRLRHVEKRPEPDSPAMARGSDVHRRLDSWLKGRTKNLPGEAKPLKAQFARLRREPTLLTDQPWAHDREWLPLPITGYFSKRDWVRAKADAVVVKPALLDVIDFKTGKPRAVSEDQVRFYGMLGLLRYPKSKTSRLSLWYVDAGKVVDDLEPVGRAQVEALRRDFEARAVRHIYEEDKFRPTPGDHCTFCPFSKYKGGPCKF